MKMDRRNFLVKGLPREVAKLVVEFERFSEEGEEDEEGEQDFFASRESSYSISLAYPMHMLVETAKKLGIDVTGKDRLQLAKEIFSYKKGESI